MRTSVLENDDRFWQAAFLADRAMSGGRDNHQFLFKGRSLLKWRIGNRLGNKCCVELPRDDSAGKNLWVAGAKLQDDAGVASMVFAQRARQPDSSGALHSAKPKRSARSGVLYSVARFVSEREEAVGEVEQDLAGRGQVKPLPLANKKRHAKIVFELPDAGGDIRLNAM